MSLYEKAHNLHMGILLKLLPEAADDTARVVVGEWDLTHLPMYTLHQLVHSGTVCSVMTFPRCYH
jgi:hypothetical protein